MLASVCKFMSKWQTARFNSLCTFPAKLLQYSFLVSLCMDNPYICMYGLSMVFYYSLLRVVDIIHNVCK